MQVGITTVRLQPKNCLALQPLLRQWRRAIEALEARAPPQTIFATVVNTPCPGKKATVLCITSANVDTVS